MTEKKQVGLQNSLLKHLKDGNIVTTKGGLGVGYPRKLRHLWDACFYDTVKQAAGSEQGAGSERGHGSRSRTWRC